MKKLTVLVCLLLSACGSTPNTKPTDGSNTFETRQQALLTLKSWRLSGKLGFKMPQQSGSAFIDWKQNNKAFRLHLSGPLGQGSITINSDGSHYTIRHNGKELESREDAQDFIKQQLGWELPVQQLRYWALGIPSPHSKASTQINEKNGLLDELQQDQWSIRYLRYSRHRHPLPQKIVLQRQQIKLTLIIHQWT